MGSVIWYLGLIECLGIIAGAFYYLFKPVPVRRRYHSIINATCEQEAYEKRCRLL